LINPAGVRSLGRPIEEILGKTDQDLWPADNWDDFRVTDRQVMESGQPITFEWGFRDGASRYVRHVSKFPYRSEKGEVLGIVAISRDITDRVYVEEAEREQRLLAEALRNSAAAINSTLHLDEVLDRILENVAHVVPHDAAVVLLVESGIARFARARGYRDEVTRNDLATMRFVVSETPNLQRMAETGKAFTISDTHVDRAWMKRREPQWHHSYAGAPICVKGRVIGFISLFSATKDFFTPTHAERLQSFADQAAIAIENARLFEESERLRAFNQNIVQSMQEGILITDAERRITFVNPKAAELLGYAPDELVGRHAASYVAPDQRAHVDQEFAKRARGIANRYETTLLTREGRRVPVLVSARPLFEDGALHGVLTVFTDITERIRAEELIRRNAAYAEALAVISKALTEAERSYQSVLDTIVQNVAQLIGDACIASLVSEDGEQPHPVAFTHSNSEAAQFIKHLLATHHHPMNTQPVIGQTIESGQAILISDVSEDFIRNSIDPGFWPYLDQYGACSLLIAPLHARGRVIGTLSAIRDRSSQPYRKEDLVFLQGLADRAALAILNARLFQAVQSELAERKQAEQERNRLFNEVRKSRVRLRVLSRRVLDAQEAERRHLARELHDEIGQVLTLIKIDLQRVQRRVRSAALKRKLAESITTVEGTLEQVRDLSLSLRPPVLDDLGLVAALRWHANYHTHRTGLRTRFVADALQGRLAPEVETICYRIVQEALTNVARHARAETVTVELRQRNAHIELCIVDDGVGFDVQAARQRVAQGWSQGLLNIEDRVLLGGGHVTIHSEPGCGTRIDIFLPVEPFSPTVDASVQDEAA
jgi:PAS domain S-box-containing protein